MKRSRKWPDRRDYRRRILRNLLLCALIALVLWVEAGSPLAGMTIREVDFQDRMTCMIIGIERGREPVMNPPADFVFAEGDVVWVVGETHSILQLSVGQHLYPSKGEA